MQNMPLWSSGYILYAFINPKYITMNPSSVSKYQSDCWYLLHIEHLLGRLEIRVLDSP